MTSHADRVRVAPSVLLDSRLALFHETERWLAVADLHYGYELSLRAAGALVPLWGMDEIETRLRALLAEYRPAQLILCGDLVHSRASRAEARAFLDRLRDLGSADACEVIPLRGNHDRRAFGADELRAEFITPDFYFHHGDAPAPVADVLGARTEILGHYHPAAMLSDGDGFRTKLPAFIQARQRWILPAFSPWAAGGVKHPSDFSGARVWRCSPRRIFPPG
ncbi:MAG: metallophosphoesterase [Verrucomicrobia bacterium]|nr:metallophosphoesterase [Verrucomicrobiota bacterium]